MDELLWCTVYSCGSWQQWSRPPWHSGRSAHVTRTSLAATLAAALLPTPPRWPPHSISALYLLYIYTDFVLFQDISQDMYQMHIFHAAAERGKNCMFWL